jgi:hypothetical protein
MSPRRDFITLLGGSAVWAEMQSTTGIGRK